jgi:tetratricopeptide (TPR) repeat protein
MARIKSVSKSKASKKKRRVRSDQKVHQGLGDTATFKKEPETAEQMYFKASELFYEARVDEALPIAQKALVLFQELYPDDPRAPYPALLLLGQIHLARAEVDLSRENYLKATEVDPDGQKTGAAPFLWSAQLSEEGGEESVTWFEKACAILRRELKDLEAISGRDEAKDEIAETRRQLGETLCSMTEVYMTDLSYETPYGYHFSHADWYILQL